MMAEPLLERFVPGVRPAARDRDRVPAAPRHRRTRRPRMPIPSPSAPRWRRPPRRRRSARPPPRRAVAGRRVSRSGRRIRSDETAPSSPDEGASCAQPPQHAVGPCSTRI